MDCFELGSTAPYRELVLHQLERWAAAIKLATACELGVPPARRRMTRVAVGVAA